MRYVLACLLSLAIGALVGASPAWAGSIEGSWSGAGIVTLTTGQKERVRCRASYSKSTGRTFLLSATCASTAGTFQQSGRVVQLKGGNRYTGRLYNPEYSVSGNISVTVSGRRQSVRVSGEKGTGRFTLRKK